MDDVCIRFGEEQEVELDEVDVGVANGVVAFDVTGRIVGLDETLLSQLAGTEWVPTELRIEPRSPSE